MPLLRRADDHRRNLRAQPCAARPAGWSPRQDRDTMTTVVTSSHRSPAGGRRSPVPQPRCRIASKNTPSRAAHLARSPSRKPRAFAPTAAVGQPRSPSQTNASLAEAVRPSNRHRRQPPRCPPRVPSLEAFGRRPSVPAVRLRMGPASETLHITCPHSRPKLSGPLRDLKRNSNRDSTAISGRVRSLL